MAVNRLQHSERESNFELLRLLAMCLIVSLHVNFFSLGWPTSTEANAAPFSIALRMIFESLAIVSVNVFVIISGWFGIKAKIHKLVGFIFQCLFFYVGIYLLSLFWQNESIDINNLIKGLALTDYWFVISYTGLYILSPVLNSYIKNTDKGQMSVLLALFFVYEFLYGWRHSENGFNCGYSTISFIGLYLLGGYMSKYRDAGVCVPRFCCFALYVVLMALNAIIAFWGVKTGRMECEFFYRYSSPFVVVGAAFLVLGFSKFTPIRSKVVNYVAASTFSIYLFHLHPSIKPQFVIIARSLYYENGVFDYCWKITVFVLTVSLIALLLDQIRKLCWSLVCV